MANWILLTVENSLAVWIPQEGDQMIYEIAPKDGLKRGDNVYLWSNPHNSFFGYGEVAETPMPIKVHRQMGTGIEEIRRYSVVVNRTKEFRPPVTEWLMSHNREVKKLIPQGFDKKNVRVRSVANSLLWLSEGRRYVCLSVWQRPNQQRKL